MQKIKFFLTILIFGTLLGITSIIKTQTRIIEKKIIKLNLNVFEVEKGLHETQLDFFYLSSPKQLEEKLIYYLQGNICLWTTQEYIWTTMIF